MALYIFLPLSKVVGVKSAQDDNFVQNVLNELVLQLTPATKVLQTAIDKKYQIIIFVQYQYYDFIDIASVIKLLKISYQDPLSCRLKFSGQLYEKICNTFRRPIALNLTGEILAADVVTLLTSYETLLFDNYASSNNPLEWEKTVVNALINRPAPDFLSATKRGNPRPFDKVFSLPHTKDNNFSHPVYVGFKLFTANVSENVNAKWISKHFLKQVRPSTALKEIFSGELLRLWLPHQPKVRILIRGNTCYIQSKDACATQSLQQAIDSGVDLQLVLNESDCNLGQVLFFSRLLRNRDLKLDNLMLQHLYRIINIDHGEFFWFDNNRYAFAVEDIKALPEPILLHFAPWNWLNNASVFTPVVLKQLQDNSYFQQSINHGILLYLLTTNAMVEKIINHWTIDNKEFIALLKQEITLDINANPSNQWTKWTSEDIETITRAKLQEYLDFTITMRSVLLASLNDYPAFKAYLQSDLATSKVNEYIHYLERFTLSGKDKLMTHEMLIEVKDIFKRLCDFFKDNPEFTHHQAYAFYDPSLADCSSLTASSNEDYSSDDDNVDRSMYRRTM